MALPSQLTTMGVGGGGSAPGPSAGDGLLLETPVDSFLLLESGDFLLLEA